MSTLQQLRSKIASLPSQGRMTWARETSYLKSLAKTIFGPDGKFIANPEGDSPAAERFEDKYRLKNSDFREVKKQEITVVGGEDQEEIELSIHLHDTLPVAMFNISGGTYFDSSEYAYDAAQMNAMPRDRTF